MKSLLTILATVALTIGPAAAQNAPQTAAAFDRSNAALVAAYRSWDAAGRPCLGSEAEAIGRQLDALTAAYNRVSERAVWIEGEGQGRASASYGARDPGLQQQFGERLGPNAFVIGTAAEAAGCDVLATGAYEIVSRLALRGATMDQANAANRYLFRPR